MSIYAVVFRRSHEEKKCSWQKCPVMGRTIEKWSSCALREQGIYYHVRCVLCLPAATAWYIDSLDGIDVLTAEEKELVYATMPRRAEAAPHVMLKRSQSNGSMKDFVMIEGYFEEGGTAGQAHQQRRRSLEE